MSDNRELLQQKVNNHRQKLDQAKTVVELTQARVDAASTAHEEADRERKRQKSALKLAKARVKRLDKDAKRSRKLAAALGQDRADAENELAENLQAQQECQAELSKAEGALAAEEAAQDVEQAATKKTTPRKRAATTTKKATPRKRTTSATKKATTSRKRTATGTTTKRSPAKKATTRRS